MCKNAEGLSKEKKKQDLDFENIDAYQSFYVCNESFKTAIGRFEKKKRRKW